VSSSSRGAFARSSSGLGSSRSIQVPAIAARIRRGRL
jgi:hypothetical protein